MVVGVLIRVSIGRCLLAGLLLLSPLLRLEPRLDLDENLSGWSAPMLLVFETLKPRTVAQSSGTFFTPALIPPISFEGLIALSSIITITTLFVPIFSLSELQRWQV
jgi:hypothetical protein